MEKFIKRTEFIKLKFKLNIFIILIIVISSNSFAQYSINDYGLAKETFARSLTNSLLHSYLASQNEYKVNSALLSIANCKDTSFIPEIIKLDFSKHGKFITFALGELGPSKVSANYLFSLISSGLSKINSRYCYDALGKVADQSYCDKILNKHEDGQPLALYQFYNREISSSRILLRKSLMNQMATSINDSLKLNDILFALSRIGPDISFVPLIKKILFNSELKYSIQNQIYALASFRKLNKFPHDNKLFAFLMAHHDWRVRAEIIKIADLYGELNKNEIKTYLSLLKDSNPNVARQTAISFKKLILSQSLNLDIKNTVYRLISENKLISNVRGELFISFAERYNQEISPLIKNIHFPINEKYIFKLISQVRNQPQLSFDILKSKNNNLNSTSENEYYEAVISLQDSLGKTLTYKNFILRSLKIGSPSALGIIISSIKDSVILNWRTELNKLLPELVKKHKNNNDYIESLPLIAEVGKKISSTLYNEILNLLSTSNINYIQNYALNLMDKSLIKQTSSKLFSNIWQFAFKYKEAIISTNKGKFTIKFLPEYAPVSVGNFCFLAQKSYFDSVTFHRVVPNFVIQTGDKSGTGWGGPGYEIKSEFSPLPFSESMVGMASAGRDTEGSQWFVMHSNFPHLNGRYTVFGKVIAGKRIVDKIDVSDRIINIQLSE